MPAADGQTGSAGCSSAAFFAAVATANRLDMAAAWRGCRRFRQAWRELFWRWRQTGDEKGFARSPGRARSMRCCSGCFRKVASCLEPSIKIRPQISDSPTAEPDIGRLVRPIETTGFPKPALAHPDIVSGLCFSQRFDGAELHDPFRTRGIRNLLRVWWHSTGCPSLVVAREGR